MHHYTPEIQQAQTMAQRIQCAAYFKEEVAVLEYQLHYGPYGYNDMIRRLRAHQPFQGPEEALQYFILPLRCWTIIQLKTHVAHVQHAVQLTYQSQRSHLIGLARGAGMSSKACELLAQRLTEKCNPQIYHMGEITNITQVPPNTASLNHRPDRRC